MKHSLKDAVASHVEAKRLDDDTLASLQARLNAAQDRGPSAADDAPPAGNRRRLLLVAAIALLGVGALTFALTADPRPEELALVIADEVASNHVKLKPLEVETSRMRKVEAFLTEVDFAPLASRRLAASRMGLTGARYCSVQGVEAAQLRYTDAGETWSLYQSRYDAKAFGELSELGTADAPRRIHIRGLAVELWVENGLLMALVGPPSA